MKKITYFYCTGVRASQVDRRSETCHEKSQHMCRFVRSDVSTVRASGHVVSMRSSDRWRPHVDIRLEHLYLLPLYQRVGRTADDNKNIASFQLNISPVHKQTYNSTCAEL